MQNKPYTIYPSAEALENERLTQAANTTYEKRFRTMMKLIRISKMISNAKIISSPIIPNT